MTLFLQHGLGLDPIAASWAIAPFAVGYLSSSAVAVRLGPKLGRPVILVGAGTMSIALGGLILLTQWHGTNLGPLGLMPVLLVYGLGQGLVFPPLNAATLSRVPTADAGSASGVLSTVQQVSFALGVAMIGSIFFAALGPSADSEAHAVALGTALLCNVALLALTFLLALKLPRTIGDRHRPVIEL
jgi:MFS family permease